MPPVTAAVLGGDFGDTPESLDGGAPSNEADVCAKMWSEEDGEGAAELAVVVLKFSGASVSAEGWREWRLAADWREFAVFVGEGSS